MRYQSRAWWALGAVAALCLASVGAIDWVRSRALQPASLLKRLPRRDALLAYVDFEALRQAGILKLLDGSKVGEDPEYRSFVEKTGFDYRRDLDAAMLAFTPNGKFLLLRGRFDWKSLEAYVRSQGGECGSSLCRMAGSAPDRRISILRLQSGLMALAVSVDDSAALRMSAPSPEEGPEVPSAPVWVSLPASMLRSRDSMPGETRLLADAMEGAESVLLAFAPEAGRIGASLEMRCRRPEDAAAAATQLTRATTLLRDMIAREHRQANPADLSGVLTAGVFRAEGPRVLGHWPIERAFIDSALAQ